MTYQDHMIKDSYASNSKLTYILYSLTRVKSRYASASKNCDILCWSRAACNIKLNRAFAPWSIALKQQKQNTMKFCSLIALQRHLLLLKFDLNYAEKTCRNWLDVKLDWLWQHEGFQIDQIHLFAKFTKFQLNMALLNWEFCNMLQCIQQRELKHIILEI